MNTVKKKLCLINIMVKNVCKFLWEKCFDSILGAGGREMATGR
jgi:hypothetical protein